MFLCPECLPKFCTAEHFSGSSGPCEGCGEPKLCHDCQHGSTFAPKQPRRKKRMAKKKASALRGRKVAKPVSRKKATQAGARKTAKGLKRRIRNKVSSADVPDEE